MHEMTVVAIASAGTRLARSGAVMLRFLDVSAVWSRGLCRRQSGLQARNLDGRPAGGAFDSSADVFRLRPQFSLTLWTLQGNGRYSGWRFLCQLLRQSRGLGAILSPSE